MRRTPGVIFRLAAVATVAACLISVAPAGAEPTDPNYLPLPSWEAFVTQQYVDLNARPPTPTESSSWVTQLTEGTKVKGELILALRRGEENASKVDPVARLYRALLARTPDASGLKFWVNRRRAGTWTLTRMADHFAGSSEFKRKYGTLTNRQFVTRIYTDVMGRPGDTGGMNYWTGKLDRKEKSRGGVMVGFSESNEYKVKQLDNTDIAVSFTYLLGRAPTNAEVTNWNDRHDSGTSTVVLVTEILDSGMYANRINALS